MSSETNKPTVGEDFASEWIKKNYNKYKDDPKRRLKQPPLPEPEVLLRYIADAVDEFVSRKPKELEPLARKVALRAVEGDEKAFEEMTIGEQTIKISATDLLLYRPLMFVANHYIISHVQCYKFPV